MMKCLVVEDTEEEFSKIEQILVRSGIEYRHYKSTDEALDHLEEGSSYDLYIVDDITPGKLIGTELAEIIRKQDNHGKIIIHSDSKIEKRNLSFSYTEKNYAALDKLVSITTPFDKDYPDLNNEQLLLEYSLEILHSSYLSNDFSKADEYMVKLENLVSKNFSEDKILKENIGAAKKYYEEIKEMNFSDDSYNKKFGEFKDYLLGTFS